MAHLRWSLPPALLGAAAVFVATARYGPGLTPDSANYFSAAASLAAGKGLLNVAGEPLVHFPPLLPCVLSAVGVVGVAAPTAMRLLNALCFAVVVAATMSLVVRVTSNGAAAGVAGLLVLFSAPMLDAFAYALSEAPFVGLLACFVLLLARFARADGRFGLVTLGLVAAAIALTRYIGIVVIPAAALVIASDSPGPVSRRVARAGFFSAIGVLPLAAWLVRNLQVGGTLTGQRAASATPFIGVLRGFVASAADWVVPWEWLTALRAFSDEPWALGAFFVAAAGAAMWVARQLVRWRRTCADGVARRILGFLALWVVFYSGFLCLSATLVSFDPIEPRFLVPLVFPVVVLVVVAVKRAAGGAKAAIGGAELAVADAEGVAATVQAAADDAKAAVLARSSRSILVGCVALILVVQVGRVTSLIVHKRAEGAGGYATIAWHDSPLLTFLGDNPPSQQVMSNGVDVLFLATGERHLWVPRADEPDEIDALAAALRRGERFDVVWFEAIDWRPYLIARRRLLGLGDFEAVHEAADGALYSSRAR